MRALTPVSLVSLFAVSLASASAAPALAAPPAAKNTAAAAGVHSELPRAAYPLHYSISVTPDAEALRFAGDVRIDLVVSQPTRTLTLNALDLAVARASLSRASGGEPLALSAVAESATQTVRLTAPTLLAPGRYRLDISYTGTINTQANGLFALDYPDVQSGKPRRALFTQFEPADARGFAPLFDEPIYKAPFDLSAVVPQGRMAVSNMPVASEQPAGPGLRRVTFRTTPRMSSYLLFLGIGDFERMAKPAGNGVEVGIVSPRGSGEQARLALDELAPLVPYYSHYFGQPYPLPKLDNVAGPGQSQFFGAMENWGAVFTFQKGLLDDPRITSPERRAYIVTTQNHEVAHQWFGDLVTMAWWDDLWLNEGFASWMETKATDHFHPDWFALLGRVDGREEAMGQDAFRTTHPIVQDVRSVEDANQAFDDITYDKGEAVIAMLEAYAGEQVWRDGLRAYMAAHKYGNSRTADLWGAIEHAGAPGLTAIATDFTTQPGIPLIRVDSAACAAGRTRVTLSQGEFTRDRIGEPSARRWRVPLLVSAGGAPLRAVLTDGRATLTVPGCGPLVINAGQLGYYRSLYQPAQLSALVSGFASLQPIDQMGLVADQFALSRAGYQPLAPALALLTAVPPDANPRVAKRAIMTWAGLYDRLGNDAPARARLVARAARAWKPRLAALGLDPKPGDPLPDVDLRAALIAGFGRIGDPEIVAAARQRFAVLVADSHALDGPLKTTWLQIAARNATPDEWDKLAALAARSASAVEKAEYYRLLGAAADPVLSARALALALTDAPGKTVSAEMIREVAEFHPEQAFDFVAAHRAEVNNLVDASGRARFVGRLTETADTSTMADKLAGYVETLSGDARKPAEAALAAVRERAQVAPRVARELSDWLAGGN